MKEGKTKVLFPDGLERIEITKDSYDRLYGDMTLENIELKQEIERLNKDRNKLYENGLNDFLELQKKREENERLNNIINKFEKFLFGELQIYGGGGTVQEYYDKLQELKGSE